MKKTLIFDHEISGHHIEYLNNLYFHCSKKINERFVFAMNYNYKTLSADYEWPNFQNITIYNINDKDLNILSGGSLKTAFNLCKLLRRVTKEQAVNNILLIVLIKYIPFLPFFINNKIKVSGIIYNIYLYKWNQYSIFSKSIEFLKYSIISNFKVFNKVYILNDNSSPRVLNKYYRTKKFNFLVDPVIEINTSSSQITRSTLSIDSSAYVSIHFGAMNTNKGTLKLLSALSKFSLIDRKKHVFIFAGKISPEIKKDFYRLIKTLPEINFIIDDKFCTFHEIVNYLSISNLIICPYSRTSQSSGVIGFSSQFNIPVLVPDQGLLAKLVKRNKLGFVYDGSINSLKNKILEKRYMNVSENYMLKNSINNFLQTLVR
jgi:hypothetical protein